MNLIANDGHFAGQAGRIHYRTWHSPQPARAALLIVPGFNAHSGYYTWVAEQLVDTGLAVYALDLRGRGQSEGERFFVDSFDDYVRDVAQCAQLVKACEPGLPLFMLGHSAGGVVACLYALDHPEELAGLICESFAFKVPAPDFALSVLTGLSHLTPHAHVLKLKNADFSRDAREVAAMDADPLIAGESQPLQTVAAMVRADHRLERELAQIRLPLLILHGTADRATKPSGSELLYGSASSRDKTLKLYDGHVHDLLNDVGKQTVMADIVQWLGPRIAQASAA